MLLLVCGSWKPKTTFHTIVHKRLLLRAYKSSEYPTINWPVELISLGYAEMLAQHLQL
ncbi:hypothetical protein C0J52_23055 [Blattella germanica]|nr:hypothetical protein C0J52_23055 [Blattella germanica]